MYIYDVSKKNKNMISIQLVLYNIFKIYIPELYLEYK